MKINNNITREGSAARADLNTMEDQVEVYSEADLVDQVVSKDIMEVGALGINKVHLEGRVSTMEAAEVSVDHKAALEDLEVEDLEEIKVEAVLVDKAGQEGKVNLEVDGKGVGTQ